jgi:hypothetical protein
LGWVLEDIAIGLDGCRAAVDGLQEGQQVSLFRIVQRIRDRASIQEMLIEDILQRGGLPVVEIRRVVIHTEQGRHVETKDSERGSTGITLPPNLDRIEGVKGANNFQEL